LLESSSPESTVEELRLTDVWSAVRKHSKLVLVTALLGTLLGLWTDERAPRLYTATATVEMNKDSASGLNLQDFSGTASQLGVGQDFMTDMLTQQAVLVGDETALSVIDKLNLMKQSPYSGLLNVKEIMNSPLATGPGLDQNPVLRDSALGIFKSGLKVIPVKSTRLMTVSYTDTDPVRAALIANTTVDAYLINHTEERYQATVKASTWLSGKLDDLKRQVQDTHKQVAEYEKEKGLVAGTVTQAPSKQTPGGTIDGGAIAMQELSALSAELTRAEVNRIAKEAVYRLTQTGDPSVILNTSATSLGSSSAGPNAISASSKDVQLIQSLQAQESNLRVRLAADQVQYGPQNPILVQLRAQLVSIHQQLQDEVGVINQQARAEYELAKADEEAMQKTVDQHERDFAALGNSLSELNFLRQDESSTRVLYQDLYNRLEEANIAAGVKSSGISVVDPARTPSHLSSPILKRDVVFGLLGGLALGLLIAILLHFLDRSLRTTGAIEAVSAYPLLGLIPDFTASKGNKSPWRFWSKAEKVDSNLIRTAWVEGDPKSQIAEAYRQIRTSILLSSADTNPRVLLFTSALSGDGKSTTAYNLAAAFAKQASKVVIIDADMRRPSLANLIGLNGKAGLSTLLYTDTPIDDVLQRHPQIENLSVITSGLVPPSPSEMVGSERFARVIADLRERFDYVIIDAPPALLVTDPVLIARHVDGTIAVIRSGKITAAILKRLWSTLAKPGTPILGYILNGYDARDEQYGYYGYGYGRDTSYYTVTGKKS
jgi:capsular exopolysaccharide synthesis family protein